MDFEPKLQQLVGQRVRVEEPIFDEAIVVVGTLTRIGDGQYRVDDEEADRFIEFIAAGVEILQGHDIYIQDPDLGNRQPWELDEPEPEPPPDEWWKYDLL